MVTSSPDRYELDVFMNYHIRKIIFTTQGLKSSVSLLLLTGTSATTLTDPQPRGELQPQTKKVTQPDRGG